MDNIDYVNRIGNISRELMKLPKVHLPITATVINTFIPRVWRERETKKSKKKKTYY